MDNRYGKNSEPRYTLCFVAMFLFAVMAFLSADIKVAVFELSLSIAVLLIFIFTETVRSNKMKKYIERTMEEINCANKDAATSFPTPAAAIKLDSNEIIWANSAFGTMVGDTDHVFGERLFDLVPEFDIVWAAEGKNECPAAIDINGKTYRIYGSIFRGDDDEPNGAVLTLWWLDVSEYTNSIDEFNKSMQTVSVIVIDNYEELINGLNDSERSLMIARVDKRLNEWVSSSGGIFVKYERDKYLYIFENRYLGEYIAQKFSILDSVREIESKNGIKVTLSIGIGKDGQSFKENHHQARLAIDMALSRGGDQAVIRNKFNFEFFGGGSQGVEKRTKVKSRVMANALAELIRDSSGVMVMGHKGADNDSIGAAVGIACIARKIGKPISVVVGAKTSADSLVKRLKAEEKYGGVFISAEDALIEADSGTLLVVVDTNRKSVVESEALLESANKVAIIDHHRRGTDYIEGAVLNLHEPYASSTCELVSELLQYIVETKDISAYEAEAILSGIVIDTKKFTMKTGVRTFEAAAYLRRAGADTTELKRVLQDDIETYVKRAEMVKLARMYHENVAIVSYNGPSTRKIAAQAADELLSIRGVKASFVLFEEHDEINISARSLGEINVQIILEKLGGGGHFDTAGAQLKDKTLDEATEELMSVIDDILG
ncbi:MAG: DHH family phosphoesterase [Oscillospiraceae bacterium]|nr:DHH family phosphoesterase [Oscillospiraceae bacterium]